MNPAAIGRQPNALLFGLLGILGFGLIWEAGAQLGAFNPLIGSSPSRIALAFLAECRSGVLMRDLAVTLSEFSIAFALALLLGLSIGLLMGLNRWLEYAVDPFIWFLHSAPLIAFYPVITILFGYGSAVVIAIAVLLAFVSIAVNTFAGMRAVDARLVQVVRAFGGRDRDVILKVVLPASIPLVLAGMRIGLGRALVGTVAGELFSSNAGLGFRLGAYAAHIRTADMLVQLIIVVAIGMALTQLSNFCERRSRVWRG